MKIKTLLFSRAINVIVAILFFWSSITYAAPLKTHAHLRATMVSGPQGDKERISNTVSILASNQSINRLEETLLRVIKTHTHNKKDYKYLRDALIKDPIQQRVYGVSIYNADNMLHARIKLLRQVYSEFEQLRTKVFKIKESMLLDLWHIYIPFSQWVAKQKKAKRPDEAYMLAINGGQGTGKTTFTKTLELLFEKQGLRTVGFSIDDLYKTHAERLELKKECPDYESRGPFGTHDSDIGLSIVNKLRHSDEDTLTKIPIFDKSLYQGDGDRLPESEWREVRGKVDIIIFEGWCVGPKPLNDEELIDPINKIEEKKYPDDVFRKRVNEELKVYQPLFNETDDLAVLYVENKENIYKWRQLQEEKMIALKGEGMAPEEVKAFVDYYMPSTERYILPLGENPENGAAIVFTINDDHKIKSTKLFEENAYRNLQILADDDIKKIKEEFEVQRKIEEYLKKATNPPDGLSKASLDSYANEHLEAARKLSRANPDIIQVLGVVDGFGLGALDDTNPFTGISLPILKRLYIYGIGKYGENKAPVLFRGKPFKGKVLYSPIHAAGTMLGLGDRQPGDSTVGHAAVARGAFIKGNLSRIEKLIDANQFATNPAIKNAIDNVLHSINSGNRYARLHLSGMVSLGYIHSDIRILYEILELCKEAGLKNDQVVLHAITDGKDVLDRTSHKYIKEIETVMDRLGVGVIGTIQGRDWIANRDSKFLKLWTDFGARVIMEGKGAVSIEQLNAIKGIDSVEFDGLSDAQQQKVLDNIKRLESAEEPYSALETIDRCEAMNLAGITGSQDRFIPPVHIKGVNSAVKSGDSFIHFGLRQDRSILFPQYYIFPAIKAGELEDFVYSTLIPLSGVDLPDCHFAALDELDIVGNSAPLVYAGYGIDVHSQAESEKGNEVTKVMISEPLKKLPDGIRRYIFMDQELFPISSANPRKEPSMKAEEIIDNVINDVEQGSRCEIFNVCNLDVIGHYGDKKITHAAAKIVDEEIGKLIEYSQRKGAVLFLFSDHGCSENLDPMHTDNNVPCLAIFPEDIGNDLIVGDGIIALTDMEPTRMKLYNIAQPSLMTGDSMLIPDTSTWGYGKLAAEILTRAAYNDFSLLRRGDRVRIKKAVNLILRYRDTEIFRLFKEKLDKRIELLCRAQGPFITEFLDRLPRVEFTEYFDMYQHALRLKYLSPEDRMPKSGEALGWARRPIPFPGVLNGFRILNCMDMGLKEFPYSPFKFVNLPSIGAMEQGYVDELNSYCERFKRFNEHNYRALEFIARGRKNKEVFHECIEDSQEMLRLYLEMMPEDPERGNIKTVLAELTADDTFPMATLERWINDIHQRLLRNFFSRGCEFSPLHNRMKDRALHVLDFGNDIKFNVIDLKNFEDFESSAAGIFIETLVNLTNDVNNKPSIDIVSNGKEAWIYINTAPHASELYVNLTNPAKNGMIHLNWFENAAYPGFNNYARVKILGLMLEKEHFYVDKFGADYFEDRYANPGTLTYQITNDSALVGRDDTSLGGIGFRARLDKTGGVQSVEVLADKLRMLSRVVVSMKNMDTIFEMPFFEAKRDGENIGIYKSMRDLFSSLGGLPRSVRYDPSHSPDISEEELAPYKDYNLKEFPVRFEIFMKMWKDESTELRQLLNKELERLGLPLIETGERQLRQEDIDRYFNRPLLLGLNSGRFIIDNNRPEKNPDYSVQNPLEVFLDIIDDPFSRELLEDAASIATVLKQVITFSEVGFIDGRRVKKGTLELLNKVVQFYCIFDIEDNIYLAYAFTGNELYELDGNNNIIEDTVGLSEELEGYGYRVRHVEQTKSVAWEDIPKSYMSSVLEGAAASGIVVSSGTRTCAPIKIHPFAPDGTLSPAEYEDRIFISDKITMDAIQYARSSKGFITVSGSPLAHPFIAVREKGRSGIIIDTAELRKGTLVLKYRSFNEKKHVHKEKEIIFYDDIGMNEVVLENGDIVIIDTKRGLVIAVGASYDEKLDSRKTIKKAYEMLRDIERYPANRPEDLQRLRKIFGTAHNIELIRFILQEIFIGDFLLNDPEQKENIIQDILKVSNEALSEKIKTCLRDLYDTELGDLKSVLREIEWSIKGSKYVDEILFREKQLADSLASFKTFTGMVESYVDFDLEISAIDLQSERISRIIGLRMNKFHQKILALIKNTLQVMNVTDIRMLIRFQKRAEFVDMPAEKGGDYERFLILLAEKMEKAKEDFIESDERYIVKLRNCGTHLKDFIGNKASEEGNLLNRQLPQGMFVPDGFVLTTLGIEEILQRQVGAFVIKDILDSRRAEEDKKKDIKDFLKEEGNQCEAVITPLLKSYHELERAMPLEDKFDELGRIIYLTSLTDDLREKTLIAARELKNKVVRLRKIKPETIVKSDSSTAGLIDATIGELIDKLRIDRKITGGLRQVYEEEGGVLVAARSSSLMEDTIKTAAAGRFTTEVYIRGRRQLMEAIWECSADYWVKHGKASPYQPIFFQVMVDADSSVIVNTINASDYNWEEVAINSSWGAGRGLMSGSVASDSFILDYDSGEENEVRISQKKTKYVFDREKGSGVREVNTGKDADRRSLKPEIVNKIWEFVVFLREHHAYPLGIELVVKGDKIAIVQVRPIAGLFNEKVIHRLFDGPRNGYKESLPHSKPD